MRKVKLFIAASLDGYIAKPNDDLSFLSMVEQEGEDYGYVNFVNTIDTIILGRKTYEWVMKQVPEYVHKDKKTYVITRTPRPNIDHLEFYTGDVPTLINELKKQEGKDIFCDGGAEIVNLLLKNRLFDELIISVIPILLGEGTRLFQEGFPEQTLKLISAQSFPKGLVALHYRCI